MNRTIFLFEERKAEVEFYYSILKDMDSSNGRINTIDNGAGAELGIFQEAR